MTPHDLRLARPLYEGLPWLYMASGAAALGASYFAGSALVSGALGVAGLIALVGGLVVWLRRRDYRRMRTRYTHPDALANETRE
jgi:nitrate reductase gamma subunit